MGNESNDEIRQADLLRRIAAQDKQALAELYDLVGGVLFAISCRILGDPQEAEEVIQDVFVQIWLNAATFDATLGKPFHWTVSITRNRCIDRLRSRQRRAQALDQFQRFATSEDHSDGSPAWTSPGADELDDMRAAVRSLPPEQRLVIELAFFGGLTHGEIAQTTGKPLGTVKAQIRRGLMKLRGALQAHA